MSCPPTPTRKASGENIPEWRRGTVRVRIPRLEYDRAAEIARRRGCEIVEVVTDAIRALPMPSEKQ
jgi:hypothetical protein